MTYIDGFVVAVPAANKQAYLTQATAAAPLFKEYGAIRVVETWGDDVPEGKVTDFRRAVKAEPDEVIVYSWIEYPDKAARDAAGKKMMEDPRMAALGDMPFDGMRMIYAGFSTILETGTPGAIGYVDGSLLAVPLANKEEFMRSSQRLSTLIMAEGATRIVDAWGDDVPVGKVTDYKGAVKANADEQVVFSWVEWPSKSVRDAGWSKLMRNPAMMEEEPPFDKRRSIFGGFSPLLVD